MQELVVVGDQTATQYTAWLIVRLFNPGTARPLGIWSSHHCSIHVTTTTEPDKSDETMSQCLRLHTSFIGTPFLGILSAVSGCRFTLILSVTPCFTLPVSMHYPCIER